MTEAHKALAQWLLDNGYAEEQSGYGHVSAEDLAEALFEHYHIYPKD